MNHGVFVLRSGRWEPWWTGLSKADAGREAGYLREMLGLSAKVFVRKP